MRTILKLSAASLALVSAVALADPKFWGPGPGGFPNASPTSVAQVKSHGWDDQPVVLRGRLTGYLGMNHYEFTDQQGGKIQVELDDDHPWGHIQKGQLIDIYGEIDREMWYVMIDVDWATPVGAGGQATNPSAAYGQWGPGGFGAPQGMGFGGPAPAATTTSAGGSGAPAPKEASTTN